MVASATIDFCDPLKATPREIIGDPGQITL